MGTTQPKEHRYGELDALRGVAVIMMVAYHFAFDLAYFYGFDIAVTEGGWRLLARATAALFLLLIGVCFVISWERARAPLRGAPANERTLFNVYGKYLRRGLVIFSGGMVISLVTFFVAPDAFVKFGILHLIGVSTLLLPFFSRLKHYNVLPGLVLLWIPTRLPASLPTRLLFPLGITYPGFASLDYYPLLPWFGVILIGMGIGQLLYVPEPPRLRAPQRVAPTHMLYPLLWAGRRALILYFLHQPALLLLLALTLGLPMI